jgi:mannose-1-phosphate guanylyltransferase
MAGGVGTRLWPLSRRDNPKQLHMLIGERTMFQESVDRLLPLFGYERILIVTGQDLVSKMSEQVPEIPSENFIIEPEGRGTAPCIGLAAIHVEARDPNSIMVVVTADHFIRDVELFRKVIGASIKAAERGHLVTLGIMPTYPSTGYGYIKQGERLHEIGGFDVFKVDRFVEKPDEITALQMLRASYYSWNSGMFVWQVDSIMREFRSQMSELFGQLAEIRKYLGGPEYFENLIDVWAKVEKESIDFGVMEGAKDVVVIPLEMGWSDIGSWSSLADLLVSVDEDNVVLGNHFGIETKGSLIWGGSRLVATIGLEDMIIVDTNDVLFICPKTQDQKVRQLVNEIKVSFSEYL